jgi:hypothetical protein
VDGDCRRREKDYRWRNNMGEARWRREDRGEELVGVREAARRRENREGAQSGRSGAAWVDTKSRSDGADSQMRTDDPDLWKAKRKRDRLPLAALI